MSEVDPALLYKLSKAVLAALRRAGKLPTRLDEEDIYDLQQEGTLAALVAYHSFDPDRGSLSAYLWNPISRAILRAAWGIANCGITGDRRALQVFSDEDDSMIDEINLLSPDVAEEIEAFDHVWKTRYLRD